MTLSQWRTYRDQEDEIRRHRLLLFYFCLSVLFLFLMIWVKPFFSALG
ncbi:MAG: hypothetical protein KF784_01860 [Fimbriimonadaceae bacterium]|nr:hypothetical protein [Fimbriimonadaceae bacterium]